MDIIGVGEGNHKLKKRVQKETESLWRLKEAEQTYQSRTDGLSKGTGPVLRKTYGQTELNEAEDAKAYKQKELQYAEAFYNRNLGLQFYKTKGNYYTKRYL